MAFFSFFGSFGTFGYSNETFITIGILNPFSLKIFILSYIISKLDISSLKNNNLSHFNSYKSFMSFSLLFCLLCKLILLFNLFK